MFSDDLPLFKTTTSKQGSLHVFHRYVLAILNNPETRNVFFFLLINISFTAVEFLYGWWCNSLGLTADAVHMLFDSTSLICSLAASVYSRKEANSMYTFGYRRVETITGFVNALALVFASFAIVWEACARLMFPQDLNPEGLLIVSFLGLLVNIVGIFAFNHGGVQHGHGHDCSSHAAHDHKEHKNHDGHNHGNNSDHYIDVQSIFTGLSNPLMHGMFLHVLADALGSVGVIFSSLLIQLFGWKWADPLCSIFIALLTLVSIYPLLISSGKVLLQRSPANIDGHLNSMLREINSIEGVVGQSNPHIWELDHEHYVATIKLQVRYDASPNNVVQKCAAIFSAFGIQNTTIQVEQDSILQY